MAEADEVKTEKQVDYVAEYQSMFARLRSLQDTEQADPEAADKEQRKLRKKMRDYKAKMTAAQIATLPEMGRGRKAEDGGAEGKPKKAKAPKKEKATKKAKGRNIPVEDIITKLVTGFDLEDRRDDPEASQATGYGFSLKSSLDVIDPDDDDDTAAGKLAEAFFQKFQERWEGKDPSWVTVFPQGKDKMIVLGPVPGEFTEDDEDSDEPEEDASEDTDTDDEANDDWDDEGV